MKIKCFFLYNRLNYFFFKLLDLLFKNIVKELELKTLEDEGKFRTWVKTTYANNAVSGIKLSDPRWKNPPTKFCNNALGKLWKSIEPTTKQTYGQLYLTKK